MKKIAEYFIKIGLVAFIVSFFIGWFIDEELRQIVLNFGLYLLIGGLTLDYFNRNKM